MSRLGTILTATIILIMIVLMSSGAFAWCSGTDCNTDWTYRQQLELNTQGILSSDVSNDHAILVYVDSSNTDFWSNIGKKQSIGDNLVWGDLNGDIISYWNFDETSGNSTDQKGSNDGVNTSVTQNTNGQINKGHRYDGVDDRTNTGETSFPSGNSAVSFSIWSYIESADKSSTTQQGIIGYGNGSSNESIGLRFQGTNEEYYLAVWGLAEGSSPTYPVIYDEWVHLVGTYDGTNLKLYVNGKLAATNSYSVGNWSASQGAIGYIEAAAGNWFEGYLDEAIVFNDDLTASEVLNLYQAQASAYDVRFTQEDHNFNVVTAPTAYWKLDETTGSTANDEIGSNDGTKGSGATVNQTGQIETSYSFDGTVNGYVDITEVTPTSISFWIKTTATNDWIFLDDASATTIQIDGSGNLLFYDGTSDASTTNVNTGEWINIVLTYESGGYNIYKNGIFTEKVTTSQQNIGWLGGSSAGGSGLVGNLDDIAFYSSVLTVEEASNLYLTGISRVSINDTSTNQLINPYHFEKINTDTNDLWAWVRVPDFDADANISVNMYYGNANVTDNQNEKGTYPSTYKAVWHMNSLFDSTSNNYDFDDYTFPTSTSTNCGINTCFDFEASNSEYLSMTGTSFPIKDMSADIYSIMFWTKPESTDASRVAIGEKRGSNNEEVVFDIAASNNLRWKNSIGANNSDVIIALSTVQYHFVGSYDTGAGSELWKNGVSQGTDSYYALSRGNITGFAIGKNPTAANSYWDGTIDEAKVLDYNVTQDEVDLLYNSESSTLFSFGAQEENEGVEADFSSSISITNAEIDLTDTSVGTQVTITDWNWLVDGATTGLDDPDSNTPTFSGATANTDYNVSLCAGGFDDATGTIFYSDCINQTINTGRWYADYNFYVYDENSELQLTGVTLQVSDGTNSESFTVNNSINLKADQNLSSVVGTTTEQITFTFSLTDYGTRYYTADLNQWLESDLNIAFALLPNELGRDIEFQVYDTDQETLVSNSYIEFFNWNKNNWVAGRRKSDTDAKVTFFINPNDANYTLRQPNADYNAVALTVNKPKDETTGTTITENWELDVGGLAWQSYSNITGNQEIQIYANTTGEYRLDIVDSNDNYFERKYYVAFIGGTTAETLQPYLVPTADAVSTTIFTISGYTQETVPSIGVRVYKEIVGVGRVLVEQVVTDAKGEALVSLVANDSYEFEVYRNGVLQGTLTIVATSTSIYLSLDDLTISKPTLDSGSVTVKFTPNRGKLIAIDTNLIQTISISDINLGLSFTSANIWVTNTDVNGVSGNDVNIYSVSTTNLVNWFDVNSTAQTLNGVSYDTNGYLVIYVEVVTNQGTSLHRFIYSPKRGFDWLKVVGFDIRPYFGCTTTNNPLIPCGTMFLIAIFASLMITIGFAIETGYNAMEGMGAIFLVVMGVFTYLTWVPYILFGIILIATIGLMFTLGGKRY